MKRKATLALCRDGQPRMPFADLPGLMAAFEDCAGAGSGNVRIQGPSPFFDALVRPPSNARELLRVMQQLCDRTEPVFHALALAKRGYPLLGAILPGERVQGPPGVARFVEEETVFAWDPDSTAVEAMGAETERPDLDVLAARQGAIPLHEAFTRASRESVGIALAVDGRKALQAGFLPDVPAVAILTRDCEMVLSIRDGTRAVALDATDVLAAVSRRRGWKSALAVAHMVAEVLYPSPAYPGPRGQASAPMRPLTETEGTLVALRGRETSGMTSVPAGSYWDNEEGEIHFGGRDTSQPNRQSFQEAESFLRLLPAGAMLPETDIRGGNAVLSFDRDGIELHLEFKGEGLIDAFRHGAGKSWSENVAFVGDAIPACLHEWIPCVAS